MNPVSLTFIYLALPAGLLLCLFSPMRWRPALLLAMSAALYFSVEGIDILLPAGVIIFDFFMGKIMAKSRAFKRFRMAVMVCSVTKSAAIIALYGVIKEVRGIHIPLGLGVICLTSAGYVIDCYLGYTQQERSLTDYALMVGFFPKLYAGPVVFHGKTIPQVKRPRMTLDKIGQGGRLLFRGLAKKVVIGDTIYLMFSAIKRMPAYGMTTLTVWMLSLTLLLSAYFTLSGLCDIAGGLAKIFGFELPENFNFPLRSVSVNDFFARFNITVNRFFRRYVYFTLGGAQGSVLSGVFNILLSTLLMGLWFGISLNLMAWGCFLSVFVMLERYLIGRFLGEIAPLFRWIYCTAVVLTSFTFFAGSSLAESLVNLKAMFGVTSLPAYNTDILYLLASNWMVLAVAVLSAMGLFGWLSESFKKAMPRTHSVTVTLFDLGLIIVTTAYML